MCVCVCVFVSINVGASVLCLCTNLNRYASGMCIFNCVCVYASQTLYIYIYIYTSWSNRLHKVISQNLNHSCLFWLNEWLTDLNECQPVLGYLRLQVKESHLLYNKHDSLTSWSKQLKAGWHAVKSVTMFMFTLSVCFFLKSFLFRVITFSQSYYQVFL